MRCIILFLFFSVRLLGQSGIEPTSFQGTPYQGGILVGVTPIVDEFTGDTTYLYQHSDTSFVKIDSLVYTDSLRLYTSQGVFTTYVSGGGGLSGSGVATRVAFWDGTSSLSSNANLYWDDSNIRLGIGTATPETQLNVKYGSFALPIARFENTGTNGETVHIKHGASTDGRYTLKLESPASTTYFDTRGYLGLGISPLYPLHVYSNTGISRFQNTVTNGDAGIDFLNPSKFWRFAINAEGGTTNNVHFRDVTGGRYPLVLQSSDGFVGVNQLTPTRQLDVNGEVIIRDLTTTTPTKIMANDNDGVLSSLGLGTGINISGGNIVNISPDQTVSLTGAGITSITGTYPNFTITSTEIGDIENVTVSAPIVGGGVSGGVNIAIDTTSSTGVATQYDISLIEGSKWDLTSGKTVTKNNGGAVINKGGYPTDILELKNPTGGEYGAGLKFTDSYSSGYLFRNGVQGTYTLDGAGNGVTNKKLHVDGGVTIGGAYDATAVDANSMNVEGKVKVGTRTGTPSTNATFDTDGNLVSSTLTSGTVTSVGVTAGSGISVTGTSPITGSGSFTIANTGDLSVTNEGIIGVGAGTPTTSVITSNTSTATGVTITAGTNMTISETTSTNGGNITLNASFTEVDGSITNEGYQGVTAGSPTSSVIQGYNSSGTATGTGTTINAAGSISISETTSTNGGQITLTGDYGAFAFGVVGNTTVIPVDGSGTAQIQAGTNITATNSGGIVTINSTAGATNLGVSGNGTVAITSSTGSDINAVSGFGIALTSTGTNMTVASSAPYTMMSIGTYNEALTTTNTKMEVIGQPSTNGDGVDVTYDNANYEIDILTTGTYNIKYTCNCKSNTASVAVIFDFINNVSSTSLSTITTHYFNNTNEFCHNNSEFNRPFTAGDRFSLYAKTAGGTTTIQDCNIKISVTRIK